MQLTVPRKTLLEALRNAGEAAAARSTIPILSHVRLTTGNGTLSVAGTDLDLAIEATVEAEVAKQGSCTAPAATLKDIVAKLASDAAVTLKFNDGRATLGVSAGGYRTTLTTLDVADFPAAAPPVDAVQFHMPAATLHDLLARTRFAICLEETRYYLGGVFLHVAGDALHAVATDGHRLALIDTQVPDGASQMPSVIVPRAAVLQLLRLAEGSAEQVEIVVSASRLAAKIGKVQLITKLIDGTFPEYQRVIPQDNPHLLRVARSELAAVSARVAIVGDGKARPIKLTLEHGTLSVTARDPAVGEAQEDLPAEYDGPPIEVGFQARYVADILDQISGNVEMLLQDGNAPTVWRGQADASALYVLMPMRVI
jgi:DNA polymerase-3 subunit beta